MNIEELQEELLSLKENLSTLMEDNKVLKQQVEDKDNRVKELEQYNQKLFLRASATQKEPNQEKEEFKSKLLGEYVSLLSDDEIETLKELEELL